MNVLLGLIEAAILIVLLIGLVAIIGRFAGYFSKYKDIK